MNLEILYTALYSITISMNVRNVIVMSGFLSDVPGPVDPTALERFKSIVRVNMYLALLQLTLFIPELVIGIVLIMRYGLAGLAIVLLVNGITLIVSLYGTSVENKVKNLPPASEAIGEEFRRVIETWKKKALPSF